MEKVKAVVQKIVPQGKHGAFAVATSEEIKGSITFSLNRSIWQETGWLEPGMEVVLSELRKKRAGWRAMKARFLKPSDEQKPANSKEKGAGR